MSDAETGPEDGRESDGHRIEGPVRADSEGAKVEPDKPVQTDGVWCRRCRAIVAPPPDKQRCPRCQCWLPDNRGRETHGGRALQLGRETEDQRSRREEIRDQIRNDLGGAEAAPSAVTKGLVDRLSEALVLAEHCWGVIEASGPLTKAGRRRAVVDLWLQATGTVGRLSSTIGQERRTRQVPSLDEYLNQRNEGSHRGRRVS